LYQQHIGYGLEQKKEVKIKDEIRHFLFNVYYIESAPHPEDTSNFAPCRDKHQLLHANEPNRRRRAIIK
jgi:hypothetical protein